MKKLIKINWFCLYLIMLLLFNSCFEKEKPIAPYQFTGLLFPIKQSIYINQLFYSFENNMIMGSSPNGAWDLCFESSSQGWHIRENSSNFIEIYRADTTNFEADFTANRYSKINGLEWSFDKSNGNPDSTAVGTWVNTTVRPFVYTGQVYLVGQWNGTASVPLKKMVFTMVNDTSYRFIYANLDGSDSMQVIIKKDTSCNNSYFSITQKNQVTIEPKRYTWDILFTQYIASLPYQGSFIPYPVRGVLLNPNHVSVGLDSVMTFANITINNISAIQFSTLTDFIGYDWKSVSINYQANTGTYSLISDYNYIVHDVAGNYYKFKFLSFYNARDQEGYPAFEVSKM